VYFNHRYSHFRNEEVGRWLFIVRRIHPTTGRPVPNQHPPHAPSTIPSVLDYLPLFRACESDTQIWYACFIQSLSAVYLDSTRGRLIIVPNTAAFVSSRHRRVKTTTSPHVLDRSSFPQSSSQTYPTAATCMSAPRDENLKAVRSGLSPLRYFN
jgi:hypothetical protein